MSSHWLGSVLIPAFNEEACVSATLERLLSDARSGEFTVVIAANGCRDATVEVARRTAARLQQEVVVLDLQNASKTAALRAAESITSQPRLYLDADVKCPTQTARALLRAVTGIADVAVPTRELDLSHCSLLARLYYSAWAELPWVKTQLAGRGAYALSPRARGSFGAFPEVVADDRFISAGLVGQSSVVVPDRVTIRPPTTASDLIRVRARVYAGNDALPAPAHDFALGRRLLVTLRLLRRPSRWPGAMVFAGLTAVAKLQARRGPSPTWARARRLRAAG